MAMRFPLASLVRIAVISSVCVATLFATNPGYATVLLGDLTCKNSWKCETHVATMTGFAFGGMSSASGEENKQGTFANHPPGACGGRDSSADWPFGTKIKISNPPVFTFRNRQNSPKQRTIFKLTDNGDPSCAKGPFWADIYHGRFIDEELGRPCECPGISNSVCVFGTNGVDNCQDAKDFGNQTVTYNAQLHR